MKAVAKYLQRYAEPEVQKLPALFSALPPGRTFEHAVVIPAYRETSGFIEDFFASSLAHCPALLIVVVNQPRRDADSSANTQLWQALTGGGRLLRRCENLWLLQWPGGNTHVLAVDRFSPALRLADKQGVGLARKIGADIAAAAIDLGAITTPWIHSTDADAQLPAQYFSALSPAVNAAAAVYPFAHVCARNPVGRATRDYERALNYYVAGLKWSGSPYAFHTIGSAIAVNAQHYCKARGFPKRAGGEDFYLLNKLAKLGAIHFPDCAPIRLRARASARVPFGTGPAVQRIVDLQHRGQPYCYYHPQTLVALRRVITAVPALWQTPPQDWLGQLPEAPRAALTHLNIDQLFAHLGKQGKSPQHDAKHFHDWFDAFRTLKFIHYLQRHAYPAVPLEEAIAQLALLTGMDPRAAMQ